MAAFTISASPGTDIWKKPPKTDIFNGMFLRPAPIPYRITYKTIPFILSY